jgi:hypothetical protein
MPSGLGECDPVQGGVELTVSDAAQSMPGFVRRPHRQRRGAVIASVGVAGLESVDAGGFADDLGCSQRSTTRQRQQSRGQLLDKLRDLLLQGVDHSGEFSAPVRQLPANRATTPACSCNRAWTSSRVR